MAFLFLEIPFEELDVNVHPSKTEVRFRRSEAVKETISEAIRGALASAGIIPSREQMSEPPALADGRRDSGFGNADFGFQNQVNQPKPENKNYEQPKIEFQIAESQLQSESVVENSESANERTANDFAVNKETETEVFSNDFEQRAREKRQNSEFRIQNSEFENRFPETFSTSENQQPKTENRKPDFTNQFSTQHSALSTPIVDSAARIPKSIEPETLSSSKIRPLSQLHESFIIAVDDEGLLLIDQHVAHERILFDKFRRKETERKIESQNLLLPETIDLSPAQAAAFDVVEEELENLGFALMKLSGRTIAVKAVPTDLPASEVRNLLAEILDTVDKEKFGGARANIYDNIAASLACKAAVKINMKLTLEKMQWLIDKLLTTSSPTTCPHGRPVILRLTMKDIERGFHRT